MDAGLTTTLREAGEGKLELLAADHQEVGQFVDEQHQSGLVDAVGVASFHLLQQPGEVVEGVRQLGEGRAEQVRQVGEGSEATALGIDKQQLELPLWVVECQGEGHGARKGGLAGAGGAADEGMGNVWAGQVEQERSAGFIEAQDR